MWNDIDYMDDYKLFTWNKTHYPVSSVQRFSNELKTAGQKYVVIIDPGVKVEKDYEAYELGIKEKIFITDNDGTTPMVNKVWPGLTTFPDFTMNKTND
jgi:alpha-glucosidase (family GH31 glycosyl hydrolase)